jgi:hypothetical protein
LHFHYRGTIDLFREGEIIFVHFFWEPMRCEQFLKTDDLSSLLRGDPRKFNRFFNISPLLFSARHLNTGQFDQRSLLPRV